MASFAQSPTQGRSRATKTGTRRPRKSNAHNASRATRKSANFSTRARFAKALMPIVILSPELLALRTPSPADIKLQTTRDQELHRGLALHLTSAPQGRQNHAGMEASAAPSPGVDRKGPGMHIESFHRMCIASPSINRLWVGKSSLFCFFTRVLNMGIHCSQNFSQIYKQSQTQQRQTQTFSAFVKQCNQLIP